MIFSGVHVPQSVFFCVVFLWFIVCRYVLFRLAIVLSVFRRFTASDYSFWYLHTFTSNYNRITGVIVSVLASSAVDRWFEFRSRQTKGYKIGIYCFSAKHAALRKKSKDWLAQNQNNISEWSDMSVRGLLFQ
jgi:hypothetical protein